MNKGKQWKWSKRIREKMKKLGVSSLVINMIKPIYNGSTKEIWMNLPPGSYVEFKSTKMGKNHAYRSRPKRLRGLCLNWPGEEVKK